MKTFLSVAFQEYIEDNNTEHFLEILKTIAEAQGGISRLAKKSSLNRQNLYKLLNGKAEPRITTFVRLMKALEIEIDFIVKFQRNKKYKICLILKIKTDSSKSILYKIQPLSIFIIYN